MTASLPLVIRANAARQRTQTDLDLNYPSDTNYVLTSFTTNVVGSEVIMDIINPDGQDLITDITWEATE